NDLDNTITDAQSNVLATNTQTGDETWTVDTTAPTIPVITAMTTSDVNPILVGTAEANTNITVVVAGATFNTVADGLGNWTIDTNTSPASGSFVPNTNGVNEVSVTSTDLAGNSTPDASANELTIDAVAPTVTIVPLITSDNTPALSGGIDDPTASINVVVNTVAYPGVNAGSTWSVSDNTIAALGDGAYDVTVIAVDLLSNMTNETFTGALVIDTNGPTVTIESKVTNDPRPPLNGTIDEPTTTLQLTVDGSPYAGTNNNDGTWTLIDNAIGVLAEGTYDIAVAATDLAGNPTNLTFTQVLTIDLTIPQLGFDAIVTNVASPSLTGAIDDPNVVVRVTIDGTEYVADNNQDGTWTIPAGTIASLAEGQYDVSLEATDPAGNIGATTVVTGLSIDLTDPSVSVTPITTADRTPALAGTIDDAQSVITIELDGGSYTATNRGDGNWSIADDLIEALDVGVYEIVATAVDPAGNRSVDNTQGELRILPSAPVASDGQNVTVSQFEASWGNPGGGVASYLLDVSEDPSFRTFTGPYDGLEVPQESAVVTNLDYATTYFYRVKAAFASGDISDYSNVVAVRTATDPNTVLDSLALVSIYVSTKGDDWVNNRSWLTGRLREWHGVTLTEARVTSLQLDSNRLEGTIPDLDEGLDLVTKIDLSANEITDVGNLSDLAALDSLKVQGNRLQFAPLESLNTLSANVVYSPQLEVLAPVRLLLQVGTTTNIDRIVSGTNNTYSWFRNGEAITNDAGTLPLNVTSISDEAIYHVEVTNPSLPDLVLKTTDVIVRVSSTERDRAALLVLYDSAGGAAWTNGVNWPDESDLSNWVGVGVSDERVVSLDLAGSNLSGFIPDDLTDIAGLTTIDLSDNLIDRIPNLSPLAELTSVDVSGNLLDFEDLEPNAQVPGIQYGNQGLIGEEGIEVRAPKDSDVELRVDIGGEANQYVWSFEGRQSNGVIDGVDAKKYRIEDIDYDNMGSYTLQVSNPLVPDLVLTSRPQTALATVDIEFLATYQDINGERALLDEGQGTLMEIVRPMQPFDTVSQIVIDNSGLVFEEVVLGDYLVGIRTDTLILRTVDGVVDSIKLLPTYYAGTFLWEEADTLNLRDAFSDSIRMQQRPRPLTEEDGDGEVKLLVESEFADLVNGGRSTKVQARRTVKRAGCSLRRRRRATGGRVENDEFELVAYKETDDDGRVTFNNLPSGTYRLTIEYPGIPMDTTSFIEFDVNEGSMEQESLTLEATVDEEGIGVELIEALGVLRRYFKNLEVFPNPATDFVQLRYEQLKSHDIYAELYDMQGHRHLRVPLTKGFSKAEVLDVSQLNDGMYLLRVLDQHRQQTVISFRILIRR
ncbi:MAG: Ig-like domain-containing protein, partial [Bacteroidota bacterium]